MPSKTSQPVGSAIVIDIQITQVPGRAQDTRNINLPRYAVLGSRFLSINQILAPRSITYLATRLPLFHTFLSLWFVSCEEVLVPRLNTRRNSPAPHNRPRLAFVSNIVSCLSKLFVGVPISQELYWLFQICRGCVAATRCRSTHSRRCLRSARVKCKFGGIGVHIILGITKLIN